MMEKGGADAVVAEGMESGGHIGEATTMTLVPQGAEAVSIPVIAAGGIEGGMSNGEELVLRAAMKPIPTLMRGLHTIDIKTGEPAIAAAERSDVCALPACETVLENVIACELCAVVLERLGGDRMDKIIERYGELLP